MMKIKSPGGQECWSSAIYAESTFPSLYCPEWRKLWLADWESEDKHYSGVRSVCTNDIMLVAGMSRWPAPGGGEKVINLTEDCVGYTLEVHNGITGSHTPHMLHLTGHIVMQYVTIRHTNTPLPVREIRPSLAWYADQILALTHVRPRHSSFSHCPAPHSAGATVWHLSPLSVEQGVVFQVQPVGAVNKSLTPGLIPCIFLHFLSKFGASPQTMNGSYRPNISVTAAFINNFLIFFTELRKI